MDDNKKSGLQRFDLNKLPANYDKLSKEEQQIILKKAVEDDLELRKKAGEMVIQSQVAEHDMAVTLDNIKNLETENKIINVKQNYKTGSGNVEINIKGGDRRFIIPIIVVLGIILIALLLIIFQ